jgi:guanylate kinase
MKKPKRRGLMLVLSAPSGAGKTTLAHLLLKVDKHIHPSISYTTRAPRDGEIHGEHYFFVDEQTFLRMVKEGEFLEYVEVFGNYYGTPKHYVEQYLEKGEDVVFDIDWQGHRSLTQMARQDVVSVFILPPSKKELLERLQRRAKDTNETIELRMRKANSELQHWQEYDYSIVNKDLDESLKKLLAILRAERLKKTRRLGIFEFVNKLISESIDEAK